MTFWMKQQKTSWNLYFASSYYGKASVSFAWHTFGKELQPQNGISQLRQHFLNARLPPSCGSAINFKISLMIPIKVFQNTYFPDTCMILNTCCWFENDFPMEILIALSILDASWYMMRPASSTPLYGTSMWGKTPWTWRHVFLPVKKHYISLNIIYCGLATKISIFSVICVSKLI